MAEPQPPPHPRPGCELAPGPPRPPPTRPRLCAAPAPARAGHPPRLQRWPGCAPRCPGPRPRPHEGRPGTGQAAATAVPGVVQPAGPAWTLHSRDRRDSRFHDAGRLRGIPGSTEARRAVLTDREARRPKTYSWDPGTTSAAGRTRQEAHQAALVSGRPSPRTSAPSSRGRAASHRPAEGGRKDADAALPGARPRAACDCAASRRARGRGRSKPGAWEGFPGGRGERSAPSDGEWRLRSA